MTVERGIGRTASGLAYEVVGSGPAVVLVHAGVADRRMWDPQWAELAANHRVVRYDLRGYGETLPPAAAWSHYADLLSVFDELGIGQASIVGASVGAGIAVEAALARPDAVASLVLAAPGGALFGDDTADLRSVWHDEVEALDRGDVDEAVEVNLRAWVDGPQRSPEAVAPDIRAFVGRMQRDAFELPEWDAGNAPETELEPAAAGRLSEIERPTLVVVGEDDQPATRRAAERVGAAVTGVELVAWPGVAHMLTLERPAAFAQLALEFLARHPAG